MQAIAAEYESWEGNPNNIGVIHSLFRLGKKECSVGMDF